jgi:hypothetical protein
MSELEADWLVTSFLKTVAPCLIKCLLPLRSLGEGLSLLWGKGIVPIRIRVPSLPLAYPRRTLLMRYSHQRAWTTSTAFRLQQGFALDDMGFRRNFAKQQFGGPKCRNGSKATISAPRPDVRCYPQSDRNSDVPSGR